LKVLPGDKKMHKHFNKFEIFAVMLIMIFSSSLFAQQNKLPEFHIQSYYGFTGLNFVPTTDLIQAKRIEVSYSTRPEVGEKLSLDPFSLRAGIGWKSFEVAFANTYIYSSINFNGPAKPLDLKNTGLLPLIPSVKYRFMGMDSANVSMAIGIGSPYGIYYVYDRFIDVKFFDVIIHGGISTTLVTNHAFVGGTFSFGKRIDKRIRNFPFQFIVEVGIGNTVKKLLEKDEFFVSFGFRQMWTKALFINTFYRLDMTTKQTKPLMGVGLNLSLDLLK
jgi:hypothetical protein